MEIFTVLYLGPQYIHKHCGKIVLNDLC